VDLPNYQTIDTPSTVYQHAFNNFSTPMPNTQTFTSLMVTTRKP